MLMVGAGALQALAAIMGFLIAQDAPAFLLLVSLAVTGLLTIGSKSGGRTWIVLFILFSVQAIPWQFVSRDWVEHLPVIGSDVGAIILAARYGILCRRHVSQPSHASTLDS